MPVINQDGFSSQESIKHELDHESRHEGVISEVSDVVEVPGYGDTDEKVEKVILTLRSDFDMLDVDDDEADAIQEHIEEWNEDAEADGDKEEASTEYIELPMWLSAKLTRGVGSGYSNSKLYDTLEKLGLAEPVGDQGAFDLLNREGDVVEPFDGLDDEDNDAVADALVSYLRDNLLGQQVKYEVSNSNRGTDDEYSSVTKVVKQIADLEQQD